jgi:hypothetical protein
MQGRVAANDPTDGSNMRLHEWSQSETIPGMTLEELQKREPGIFVKLAKATGYSRSYISQCAIGYRKPGPKMALKLAGADRRLRPEDLRPDIFGEAA